MIKKNKKKIVKWERKKRILFYTSVSEALSRGNKQPLLNVKSKSVLCVVDGYNNNIQNGAKVECLDILFSIKGNSRKS